MQIRHLKGHCQCLMQHNSTTDAKMQLLHIFFFHFTFYLMMTAKIKLNTKRADACRPATSATRKQSLHTGEEEGSDIGKHFAATLHGKMPTHIIYLSDNKNRLKAGPRD